MPKLVIKNLFARINGEKLPNLINEVVWENDNGKFNKQIRLLTKSVE